MFFLRIDFWKFIIVGFLNTFNYYILYLLFKNLLQMNYISAHLTGFIISMIGSFFMNSYFTYRTKPTLKKFLQFPLTYVVNITISTAVIYILVQWINLNDNLAPIIASIVAIPFTFLISKKVLTSEL